MNIRAINKHPSWKLITSINIRSISCHLTDLLTTPNIRRSNVICIQETWIEKDILSSPAIEGFKQHYVNAGRGKGIGTFYREGLKLTYSKVSTR